MLAINTVIVQEPMKYFVLKVEFYAPFQPRSHANSQTFFNLIVRLFFGFKTSPVQGITSVTVFNVRPLFFQY